MPLSGHYKWALDQLFYKHNFSRVIILEGECAIFFSTLCIFLSFIVGKNVWKLIGYLYSISDDMEIAPDFFDYFEATAALLDKDKYVFKKSGRQIYLLLIHYTSKRLLYLCLSVKMIYFRSIMAVSSWNDNGQKQFVHDPCKFVQLIACILDL